ncbi:hypothetical protein [Nocardia sp. XZ_19_385]|uniref:hypothetical protein n=1 Tax=Nocardia sp. XZ_19_385 TaxID=2769488 RepID=UPI00188E72AA|nr:hypothetical protein [Nocardia sp. XZ_19_385]
MALVGLAGDTEKLTLEPDYGGIMSKRWLCFAAVAAVLAVTGCGTSKDSHSRATTSPQTSRVVASTTTTTTTPPPPLLNRRGENGEVVQQDGLVGSGSLTVINDDKSDVAVVVTNGDPKAPQATIYVQGNSRATLSGISGTYYVYLKSGTDWDQSALAFTRNRQFQKFDDSFDESSDWEVTLKPSIGGNASTSDVPAF